MTFSIVLVGFGVIALLAVAIYSLVRVVLPLLHPPRNPADVNHGTAHHRG